MNNLNMAELQAGLDEIKRSPQDEGTVAMIVVRPQDDKRLVLETGQLSVTEGLVGDNWLTRGSRHTEDGRSHPDMQITLMNARVIQLIAQTWERWLLAGDQFYVDFDLSDENLQAGDRLEMGTAVIEITNMPHNGCLKFAQRFGHPAHKFVNMPAERHLNLRGIYAKVVQDGTIQTGDSVRKL